LYFFQLYFFCFYSCTSWSSSSCTSFVFTPVLPGHRPVVLTCIPADPSMIYIHFFLVFV
jgi:hypothetical protein